METVQPEKARKKNKSSEKHPLDRKFSSWEEAAKAKTDYVMADKPAWFFEKIKELSRK
ncbi:hypothetical protein [Dyadobacter sp. CY323]|uniref:hypothetical protein n=1 Tax=Dyadobacter sp. CY323 TaxID=2907302 RepID=UPI001F3ECEF5|nr:hypothetical protein [Dyadobacter sp. CY323]MCE6989627.1 hypothetical protein [Dyadobacter sp. CY323]